MIRVTELGGLVSSPDVSLREVLARINRSRHLFQLVLDAEGRLLGTVTDGDVRRALLRGVTLDEPAQACMNLKPVLGLLGDGARNRARLRSIGTFRAFLPLLDGNGIVREILIAKDPGLLTLRALVMAGGRGKRLGKRTRTTPKPLLSVGGKPILEHVLRRLEEAEIMRIYVAVHYLADQIEAFVTSRSNRSDIAIIHEEKPLGTAGAVARLPDSAEPLLVVNGDVLTNVDISAFAAFHHLHDNDATIAVAQYEVRIPFGVVRHADDGGFLGVQEKPATTHFVAAGMYCLSPEAVALVPSDQPMDMPDLLNRGRSGGLRIGLFPIHEYWVDLGHPEDLRAAESDYRARQ